MSDSQTCATGVDDSLMMINTVKYRLTVKAL